MALSLALNDGVASCVCEKGYRGIECAIGNSAPVITSITRTSSAVSTTGMPVILTANFTDADDTLDAQIIAVNWGDGSTIVPTSYATGIKLEHSYSAAGAYTIGVTITDASNAVGTRADNITNPTVTVIDCNGHGTVSTINSAVTAACDCETGHRGATCTCEYWHRLLLNR
jgi:PKD domain